MTILGIVGGTGPESTIEYYRLSVSGYRTRRPDGGYPSIVIDSIDMTRLPDAIGRGDLDNAADYLTAELHRLAAAGADIARLAANTPHVVFPQLQRRSPLPLISIVDATCSAAAAPASAASAYSARASPRTPATTRTSSPRLASTSSCPKRRHARNCIRSTWASSSKAPFDRRREILCSRSSTISNDATASTASSSAETELSLLIDDHTILDLPVLNTTRIHADAAVDALVA
jgi:aspartate racemase